MSRSPGRAGFTLRARMLLFTFGVVVALLGLSLAVIRLYVKQRVHSELARDLEKTHQVFERFLHERGLWLRSQSLVVAEDPRFNATVDIPAADPEYQARTAIREAKRFQALIGSPLFTVTDRSGRALARIRMARPAAPTGNHPWLDGALAGKATTGTWRVDGRDYQVVAVPVRREGEVLGALIGGFLGHPPGAGLDQFLLAWGEAATTGRMVGGGEADSLAVLLGKLQLGLGADLLGVADPRARLLDLVVYQTGYGEQLAATPGVAEALAGGEHQGLYTEEGRLFQVVSVPVFSQDQIIGTLSTGYEIDDRLARQLQAMTLSEVTFAAAGRVLAATGAPAARRLLETRLGEWAGRSGGPFEMALDGVTYLSLAYPFGQGFYLIQRSLDEATEFLRQLEQVLLVVGAGVLVIAALFSLVGVGRIARPVEALVEGTRRLAAGELGHRLQVSTGGELGELADSFNHMTASLDHSREALAESERRYRDLFDSAQDLVYTTDLEMRLTSVNRAGLEFLGRAEAEVQGRPFYELLIPEDARRLEEEDRQLPPGAMRPVFEARFSQGKGQQAVLEVVSRWITEGGKPVGTHGVGRDLTARREREQATQRFREQLAQAEKLRALGEMAAGVAHNFNNLLTVVLGNAEMTELRPDLPEAVRQDLRRISEAARRCAAIVRRIQTFGRPIDLNKKAPVDLHQVVRDTVDITRPRWKTEPERQGRAMRIDLALEPVPLIASQGSAWEEILSNLIFNAVDAMPRGGIITIGVASAGQEVVLRVTDTGVGMDEQTRQRVFEPFFTTKGPEQGTGLGLSTVWGLVQGMGGQVELDSEPGRGTTLAIRVPLSPPAAPASPEEAAPVPARPLRLLVVDDEPLVLELLPALLQGHQVDTACGGEEGLQALERQTYDAVITDWVMPQTSGLEIIAAARRAPGTVVVLMTGWQQRGTTTDPLQGVDLVLPKPFERVDVERLLQQIWQELNRRQPPA
ncbi:MAG: PAS domain S-box protein [Candidatus Latescibacteria bacterium]|nr:PAS domain S-box protein [Candidatus Latescibacterota bacterium]